MTGPHQQGGFIAVVTLIRDVGFPIVVGMYLLMRMDSLMRDNTAALVQLVQAVALIQRGCGGN